MAALLSPLIFVLFVCWCLLFLPLFPLFLLIPTPRRHLSAEQIREQRTICWWLHNKGLISADDFAYEVEVVGTFYDAATFRGYQLLVAPAIFLLRSTNIIDGLTQFLVRHWIIAHNRIIEDEETSHKIIVFLAKFATTYAHIVGRFVMRFS